MDPSLLNWSKTTFEEIENYGIYAGDSDGQKVYVGRAVDRDGNFVPVQVIPALKKSFYAYNDGEESVEDVEILDASGDYKWVSSEEASIEEAVSGGGGSFIGRGFHNGNVVVGRIDAATKKLIGSHDGEAFKLSSYEMLIQNSKDIGIGFEAYQKSSSMSSKMSKSTKQFYKSEKWQTIIGGTETTTTTTHDVSYLLKKIRQLEFEKQSYLRDKLNFEERITFEQRKVIEMSELLMRLRVENSRFLQERKTFEEKFSFESRKLVLLEAKLNEFTVNNSYLLKKVTTLEESIRIEKQLVQSVTTKYSSTETYTKTLLTKFTNFEETIKTQQQRIFELEGEIMMTSSNSETLVKRVTEYEDTIKHLRIEFEGVLKRLEISSNDNEFLIQKLTMLSKTLRSYQSQIECLSNKLQSSKTVIATAHSDLSRANLQISKYQSALSSCYVLNGELMTKVSGLNSAAQVQVGSECQYNLINYSATGFGFGGGYKSSEFSKTSRLLELTGSDLGFMEGMSEAQTYESKSFVGGAQAYGSSQSSQQQFQAFHSTNGATETETSA